MNKLTTIFLFEFRSMVRRRLFLIMTASLPVLGIALILIIRIVTALAGDDEPRLRGYVDEWGPLPAELPTQSLLRPYLSEDDALTALLDDDIESYYVIPATYVESGDVKEYTTSPIGLGNPRVSDDLRTLLLQSLVGGVVTPEIAARVHQPALLDRVRLTYEGEPAPEERNNFSRFAVPVGFSMLLFFSIIFSNSFLVQSVTEEKQSRTIEVLLSSVSPFTLMAGKILGLGAAGLLQILVWLIALRALVSFAGSTLPLPDDLTIDPETLGLAALFFVLAYVFLGTIVAGVGAIVSSPQQGDQIAGFIGMTIFIPGLFMPHIMEDPDGTLARVFTLIPVTSPITVMLRLSAATPPWLDIAGGALLLAVSSIGALFLASRVFRAHLLLHGKRPALREIWRALRTA